MTERQHGKCGRTQISVQLNTDELKSRLGVRPDDIMINMVFVDKEDWSFGDGKPW